MNEIREITCIVCPVGCRLQAVVDNGQVASLEGNTCKRGASYATAEICSPTRMVTTTVRVNGGFLPLVPVRTESPIPKGKIGECLEQLSKIVLTAPVNYHEVVVRDIAGTGVAVVATRPMPATARGESGHECGKQAKSA